jgi:hypothetical protein
MVHAVSLTTHIQKFCRITSKSENLMQNSDSMQKKLIMHSVSMTPHALCMRCHWHRINGACGVIDTACKIWHRLHDRRTIRTALAAFKRNIYQKHIHVPELSYPTIKKYINLKGLPNKKCSCMRCHWHRMHDFRVRKSIISRRIRSRIQKGFSPWISGPGGIVWWKTEGRKSRDTVPLTLIIYDHHAVKTHTNGSGSYCSQLIK